jgi:hypothetical protein
MMDVNQLNIFGICRLHKHFVLKENECVVTSKTPEGYLALVKPYSEKYYPWIWRFIPELKSWVPTEFFEVTEEVETSVLFKIPPVEICSFVEKYLDSLGDISYNFGNLGLCIDICKFYNE